MKAVYVEEVEKTLKYFVFGLKQDEMIQTNTTLKASKQSQKECSAHRGISREIFLMNWQN